MTGTFLLPSGRPCRLAHPRLPGLPRYHVLSVARRDGTDPTPGADRGADLDAMVVLARQVGRRLGLLYFGDGEAFALVFNGRSTRRRGWPHVHILPVPSPAARRHDLILFFFKRWLTWLARLGGRWRPDRRLHDARA